MPNAHILLPITAGIFLLAGGVVAEPITVPSAHPVTLQEMLLEKQDNGALWARARYVMPAIGQGASFDEVEADLAVLCEAHALPELAQSGKTPAHIVVSLASEKIEFGAIDSAVIQYFDQFRPENATCIWEGF